MCILFMVLLMIFLLHLWINSSILVLINILIGGTGCDAQKFFEAIIIDIDLETFDAEFDLHEIWLAV